MKDGSNPVRFCAINSPSDGRAFLSIVQERGQKMFRFDLTRDQLALFVSQGTKKLADWPKNAP